MLPLPINKPLRVQCYRYGMLAHIDQPDITGADAFNDLAARQEWPVLCDDTCTFQHPSLFRLLHVWRGAADANGIPYRRALTARMLQPFMRAIAIYERITGSDGLKHYRIRLFGSGWVEFYGELTGRLLDEVIPEPFVPRWHAFPDAVLGARAPLRMVARCDTFGKQYMTVEMLGAPMMSDDGAVRFALMAAHFDGIRSWEDVEAEERHRLAGR